MDWELQVRKGSARRPHEVKQFAKKARNTIRDVLAEMTQRLACHRPKIRLAGCCHPRYPGTDEESIRTRRSGLGAGGH